MALEFPSWVYLASTVGSAILEASLHLRIGYLFFCRCNLRIWTGLGRRIQRTRWWSRRSRLGVLSLMAFHENCSNSFARDYTQRNDREVVFQLFVSATV
jgi:hypothetical protein